MDSGDETNAGPRFVVLEQEHDGRWKVIREFERVPGLAARAARARAVWAATNGNPEPSGVYAAVLRSE
ncbi:MAG: hypothetical protein P4L46_22720 [Fimbriimonas sp.]|nr:hypothetical protein [Fimbriimonas sp.]